MQPSPALSQDNLGSNPRLPKPLASVFLNGYLLSLSSYCPSSSLVSDRGVGDLLRAWANLGSGIACKERKNI